MAESAIAVGSQFSPNLIDLAALLKALIAESGNKARLEAAVWAAPVRKRPVAKAPTKRRSSLPVEAAVQYGLLEPKTYAATPLTAKLAALKPPDLYDEWARHILLNSGGLRVVEAAQQMAIDGQRITGDTLARYLTEQGFAVTIHNTAINSMRMYLALAGIFDEKGWKVDSARKAALLGLSDDQIAALAGFNPEQRAFALALCQLGPTGRVRASDVRSVAATILGRTFGHESLPKTALEPLKVAGLIDYDPGGTASGKSAVLWTLPAFQRDLLRPFLDNALKTLDAPLTAYFNRPWDQIYKDLDSPNTFVKGQALEAFAIRVMRLLGLRFAAWRKRSSDTTARAEIDVVMTGLTGALPAVWQIQCKNTPGGVVSLEDVGKEVGLLPLTKATHILVLANARISRDAVEFATKMMRDSSVVIFLIGKSDFEKIRARPAHLVDALKEQAEVIIRLRHEEAKRVLAR